MSLLVKINGYNTGVGVAVSVRCPGCRQKGVFLPFNQVNDLSLQPGGWILGQRMCPDPKCKTHIFFIWGDQQVKMTYPIERIEFDTTGVPTAIVNALDEAITCLANNCFVAAGIMVRKTLEELCNNRGAIGPSLKARIASLANVAVLPPELFSALDDLRLLGNDAAHIESQTYAQVGKEEIEVAIDLTKEILKAVYQYSSLVDRLRKLKKP